MFPGESTMGQLERIIEVTGKPSKIDMKAIKSKHTQTMIDGLQVKPQKSLASLYPTAPIDAIDLLSKLLQFNPERRYTIDQAIGHPYLAQFHNSSEEPVLTSPIQISLDDNKRLKIGDYRRYLYKKIVERKKQLRKKRELAAAAAGLASSASSSNVGQPGGSPPSSTKPSRSSSANVAHAPGHNRQPSNGTSSSASQSSASRNGMPSQKPTVASSASSATLPPANQNRTMQTSQSAASIAKKR